MLRLNPGDRVYVDETFNGWSHISGVPRLDRDDGKNPTDGRVSSKWITSYGKGHFVVRARCNNGEESNVLHQWRLLNSGRRLEIRDAKEPSP